MSDEELLSVLRSIDRRLAILSASKEQEIAKVFRAEVLRTENRASMWHAIDGRTTTAGIANAAGVSDRLAQMFVKELREFGFVHEDPNGSGTAQDFDAVLAWFLERGEPND
jgi:hypothetical protein